MSEGGDNGSQDDIVRTSTFQSLRFRSLKSEIDTEMALVHQTLEGVTRKIKANVRSEDNPNGLLVQQEYEYLRCLELQHL